MSLLSEYVADGATCIYDLEEGSGSTVAADSSGHGNVGAFLGTLFLGWGAASLVPSDPSGHSITFGGLTQTMVAASGSWHNNPNAFSVACRFKLTTAASAGAGTLPTMISKYAPTFAASQFILRVDSNDKLTFYGMVGSGLVFITGTTTILANVEYTAHLTIAYNSGTNQTTAKIYLNGVLEGTNTFTGALNSITATNFTVGNRNNSGGGANTGETISKFNGPLDAVAYFPSTLSAARVLVHHNAATHVLYIPDPPGDLAVDFVTATSVKVVWSPPAGADEDTGYRVRLDGGVPVDLGVDVDPEYVFTGLDPVTTYSIDVMAYSPDGDGDWSDPVEATTTSAGPDEAYAIELRVGSHSWSIVAGDTPDPDVPNPLAGLRFGWSTPDDKGWPVQAHVTDPDLLTFRLAVPSAEAVADIAQWDVVRFKFTPHNFDYDAPLVDFAGRVTGLPKITDRTAGGVYLDLAAADYRVDYDRATVYGLDLDRDTGINGEADGELDLIQVSMSPYAALAGIPGVDEDPEFYGAYGVMAEDDFEPDHGWLVRALNRVPWWPIAVGQQSINVDPFGGVDYSLGFHSWGLPTVTLIHGQDRLTLGDVFRTLGLMPTPHYASDTGNLIPSDAFRHIVLDSTLSDVVETTLSADLVPTSLIEWRWGYTPNVFEQEDADGNVVSIYWSTEDDDYDEQYPANPRIARVRYSDVQNGTVNLDGFRHEAPGSEWGPYRFTVRAYIDPTKVRDWFTYPDRQRQYVTLADVDPIKSPNGESATAGLLRGADLVIPESGRWYVEAGLRLGIPDSLLGEE